MRERMKQNLFTRVQVFKVDQIKIEKYPNCTWESI